MIDQELTLRQMNAAQRYVSMSRVRRAMHVFTDCKGALRDAVLRPSDRLSATELVGDLRSAGKTNFERELRKIRQETGGVPADQLRPFLRFRFVISSKAEPFPQHQDAQFFQVSFYSPNSQLQ